MPFINNDKIKLYYETEGVGAPVVLIHGFSSDLNSWKDIGWVKSLKNN